MRSWLYLTQNLPKRSNVCSNCAKRLEEHDPVHSTLIEAQSTEIQRKDACSCCFDDTKEQTDVCLTYWKSKKQQPEPAKISRAFLDQKAYELLLNCLKENTPHALQEAQVLLLYLMRRKRIRIKEEKKIDGILSVVYEHIKTEEECTLPKIDGLIQSDHELEKSLVQKLFGVV